MAGELDGYDDRSRLRISDADRHRVAELLREAAGEGRLDMEELDQRLEAAYGAKTYGDLVPITADLPIGLQPQRPAAARPRPAVPMSPAPRYDTSIAIMGSSTRRGVWEVGATHTAVAIMAGVEIDLREARFTSAETVIWAYSFWGGIDIYVNEHTQVVVEGFGIMGGFDQGRDKVDADLTADSPIVRVKGLALMAGVTVQRRPSRDTPRRGMLGH